MQQLADEIAARLIGNQEVLAAEPQDTELEFVIQDNNATIQNPQQPTIQLANHPCWFGTTENFINKKQINYCYLPVLSFSQQIGPWVDPPYWPKGE